MAPCGHRPVWGDCEGQGTAACQRLEGEWLESLWLEGARIGCRVEMSSKSPSNLQVVGSRDWDCGRFWNWNYGMEWWSLHGGGETECGPVRSPVEEEFGTDYACGVGEEKGARNASGRMWNSKQKRTQGFCVLERPAPKVPGWGWMAGGGT